MESAAVLPVKDLSAAAICALADRYSIALKWLDRNAAIGDSYWGEPEAGISSLGISLRGDTPMHSLLHELCHIVCMTAQRRRAFARDAGGTEPEECAVCYLQVLLAEQLPGYSAARCLSDMDAWGYSFREGSAAAWFRGDGREAQAWLLAHDLIDTDSLPTFQLRK